MRTPAGKIGYFFAMPLFEYNKPIRSAHHRHLLPHSRLGVAVVFTFKIPARCEPLLGKSDTSLRCRCLNTTNPSNVKQSRKIAWIRGGIALPKTTGMSSSYFRTATWHVGAIHEVKHRD